MFSNRVLKYMKSQFTPEMKDVGKSVIVFEDHNTYFPAIVLLTKGFQFFKSMNNTILEYLLQMQNVVS